MTEANPTLRSITQQLFDAMDQQIEAGKDPNESPAVRDLQHLVNMQAAAEYGR